MTQQKSKFLTFIFSLMPGCGQLYMGFMKRGLTLLTMFFAAIALCTLSGVEELLALPAIVWFYAFFDSMSIRSLTPERFALVEDGYIFFNATAEKPLVNRWLGIISIVIGALIIWNTLITGLLNDWLYNNMKEIYSVVYNISKFVPKLAVAALVIVIGVRLIARKKEETRDGD